jgi:hypothetical protein
MADAVFMPAGPVHPSTLIIWAAFLASRDPRAKFTGTMYNLEVPFIPDLDRKYIGEIQTLQHLFRLLPLIKSKELDPDDAKSIVVHLVQLGRSLFQSR